MAVNRSPLKEVKHVVLNNTLTSGITKSDASKPISEIKNAFSDGFTNIVHLKVNELSIASASSASLAFGEHIASFPSGSGIIVPLHASILLVSETATGQAATAGEVGLGSVIGSGAVSTLGGTATFEDIMEGTTLSNHVAATELVSEKFNRPILYGDHGATAAASFFDASAADVKIHLNLATAYDNASTAAHTFSADIVLWYQVHGENFGVPNS